MKKLFIILGIVVVCSCQKKEPPQELLSHWKKTAHCSWYDIQNDIGFNCWSIESSEPFPLEYEFFSDWSIRTNKYHPNCIGEFTLSDYNLNDFDTKLKITFPCNTAYLVYNIIKIEGDTLVVESSDGVEKMVRQ